MNSTDSYQPIALASILSKATERILLTRSEMFVLTTDNQVGFTKEAWHYLCIYVCIYALKYVVESNIKAKYGRLFYLFYESMAFDRIHD